MEEKRGEAKQGSLLSIKGGHRCAEQRGCAGLSGAHTHTRSDTRTHATHTHTQCYLWDLTQVQMLHSDLLDSASHVNIQEWRETERGKDGWGMFSREGWMEKRYFLSDGGGAREQEIERVGGGGDYAGGGGGGNRECSLKADSRGWSIKANPTMSTNGERKHKRTGGEGAREEERGRIGMEEKDTKR